jgi:hypothetical protein
MLREASRWPASTPSKPISLAKAITIERAASSPAQVNTVGFSPLAGSRIMRRSSGEYRRKGSAHAPRADNDNLFHASPPWSKTDGL